jgi:hypothetical protein
MFVKITNGQVDQYPYTVGDLRKANPNVSFPRNLSSDTLAQFGVYAVTLAPAPSTMTRTHRLVTQQPTQVDGVWTVTKAVVAKDQAQVDNENAQMAANVRAERNQKLSQSDWTQGKDIADDVSTAWATYRQALRDITLQEGFPENVTWPEIPE